VVDVLTKGNKVVKIAIRLDSNNQIVVVTRSNYYSCFHNNRRLYKKTFPLILAYAITAHKCQGMTMSARTFLHVRGTFAPGLLYVMLSRVPRRDMLYIIGLLSPDDFQPVKFPSHV
jgi:ATP-dependent exoDNAse (exonuclease V) alpha subunit